MCIRIIGLLSRDEMGLFQEHIGVLDTRIRPGLTKLMWSFMGTAKEFIQDCLLHVDKVGTRSSPSEGKASFLCWQPLRGSVESTRVLCTSTLFICPHVATGVESDRC